MKVLITSLGFCLLTTTFVAAQDKKIFGTKLILAGQEFKIPNGCIAESRFEVRCDDYNMGWLVVNDILMEDMPEQFVKRAAEEKNFKKEKIKCAVTGVDIKGWLMTYTNQDGETNTEVVANGKIRGEAIIFNLKVLREVKTNADLPGLVAEIFQIVE